MLVSEVLQCCLHQRASSFVQQLLLRSDMAFGVGFSRSTACRSATAASPAHKGRRNVVLCAVNVEQLKGAKAEIAEIIKSSQCNPIIVRLGWHDSGTHNKVRLGEALGAFSSQTHRDRPCSSGLGYYLQGFRFACNNGILWRTHCG